MKKTIFLGLLTASLALYGCQQQPGPTASGTPKPAMTGAPAATETPGEATPAASPEAGGGVLADYKAPAPDAQPGQFVFVPMQSSCEALMKGEEKRYSDIRPRELVKTGEETSTIKDREEFEAPNSLIIPTQPDAKAAVGDIVLGNPQYSSWQVAIVTDAADPAAPTVHFFKPVYSGQSPEGDQFMGTLEAGKFRIVTDAMEPGTHVLYPDGEEQGYGQLISTSGDSSLVSKFGGELEVFKTADLTGIPVKPALKQGDKVQAPFAKGMDPATVSKVDEKIGRIWVTFDGRESQGESVFCYGEVLPAQ